MKIPFFVGSAEDRPRLESVVGAIVHLGRTAWSFRARLGDDIHDRRETIAVFGWNAARDDFHVVDVSGSERVAESVRLRIRQLHAVDLILDVGVVAADERLSEGALNNARSRR